MSGAEKSRGYLESIKENLLKRKRELENELGEKESTDLREQVRDIADQVFSTSLETLKTSLKDKELEEYKMIVASLNKIAEGTYGVCVDCGNDISEKRLQAYPNVLRCLICQEKAEAE